MPINKIAQTSLETEIENYINIVRTGQSVSDTGWGTYVDAPAINPVDGVSGTANITWSQNLVNPMNADADLRLVKDAFNRQGQGVSIRFSVDNKHLAKVLQITFDTELISGNYENPILVPVAGSYSIASTTCTITANHSFLQGQQVFLTVTTVSTGAAFPNGPYTVTAITATTFSVTVASGSGTGNCTYTAIGDLRISIIQDPDGTPILIEPVNTDIQLGIVNQRIRHIANFQTHVSIRSYRLCVHVASTSTLAYTVDFANFKVWEPTQSIGAVITEPIIYIPTVTNLSLSSSNLYWNREGSYLYLQGIITLSGNAGGGEARIGLPSGFVVSSNISSIREVGRSVSNSTGFASPGWQGVLLAEPNTSYITFGRDTTTTNALTKLLGSDSSFAALTYTINAKVPIAGWGSSVAMSSDSGDGRTVSLLVRNPPVVSSSNGTFIFANIDRDTHGGYNSTNGKYTIPISGDYFISAGYLFPNNTVGTAIYCSIDGSTANSGLNFHLSYSNSNNVSMDGSRILSLLAGQTIEIKINNANNGGSNTNASSYFSVHRISASSQVIAMQETVACSYYVASNQTSLTTQINFGTRIYDTHGAVTTGTGWRFTAPMSGKYRISGFLVGSGSMQIHLFKNNSMFYASFVYLDGSGVSPMSYEIDLLARDWIDLRPNSSATINGQNMLTAYTSSIQISRIGM